MSIDLELIRARTPLEILVGEHFNLRKSGSRYVGVEHDSLVVTPQTGFYFWNSRGEYGDVFDFAGRYLLDYGNTWNNRDGAMFKAAVQCLAQRAGIPYEMAGDTQDSPRWAERELVARLHETLLNTPCCTAVRNRKPRLDAGNDPGSAPRLHACRQKPVT